MTLPFESLLENVSVSALRAAGRFPPPPPPRHPPRRFGVPPLVHLPRSTDPPPPLGSPPQDCPFSIVPSREGAGLPRGGARAAPRMPGRLSAGGSGWGGPAPQPR